MIQIQFFFVKVTPHSLSIISLSTWSLAFKLLQTFTYTECHKKGLFAHNYTWLHLTMLVACPLSTLVRDTHPVNPDLTIPSEPWPDFAHSVISNHMFACSWFQTGPYLRPTHNVIFASSCLELFLGPFCDSIHNISILSSKYWSRCQAICWFRLDSYHFELNVTAAGPHNSVSWWGLTWPWSPCFMG